MRLKSARPLLTPPLLGIIVITGLLLPEHSSRAVQAPRMSLDMVTDGNAYDETTNTMTVGTIENCFVTDPPGDNAGHSHIAHLVIQNVEDMVGWQARMNYDGGMIRVASVNFTPFADGTTGQNISFLNLPLDSDGTHRGLTTPGVIPPPAPGPQSAFVGAVYDGAESFAVSPDTPAKDSPDSTSYRAPNGGVLAAVTIEVLPGQAGQAALAIDLDDYDPNPPGSTVVVFNGTGPSTIALSESALSDGFHAEGVACAAPPPPPPPATPPDGGTGAPGSPGPSPGDGAGGTSSPGANGASPGATGPSGTAPAGDQNNGNGAGGNDDGDGSSAWLYALIGTVAVLAALAGFAAWRYRSRIPWLKR